jgi:hypothetical protein
LDVASQEEKAAMGNLFLPENFRERRVLPETIFVPFSFWFERNLESLSRI